MDIMGNRLNFKEINVFVHARRSCIESPISNYFEKRLQDYDIFHHTPIKIQKRMLTRGRVGPSAKRFNIV